MNDSERARARAMDVELGRMLSAESGPEWQQKVTAATRAGRTINATTPPPQTAASLEECRIALEALAELVWKSFGQRSLDVIVLENLAETASESQLEALAAVSAMIWPPSLPSARTDSADQ